MTIVCAATGCSSRMGVLTENGKKISFHRFPIDPDLRQIWTKNVKKGEDWSPSQYTRICSLHFEDSCFREGYGRRTLHSTAVPTILPKITPPCQAKVTRKRKFFATSGSSGACASTLKAEENDEEQKETLREVIEKYGSSDACASTSIAEENDEEQKETLREVIEKYGSSDACASTSIAEENDEEQKETLREYVEKYGNSGACASTSSAVENDEGQHSGSLPKISHATQTENYNKTAINNQLLKTTKLLDRYKKLAAKRRRNLKCAQRKCYRLLKKKADLEIIIETLYKKMESEHLGILIDTLGTDNQVVSRLLIKT